MSEKNRQVCWQDHISLKEYIESRLAAMEKASDLQRIVLNTRLESMNEFRASMSDQAARFITKDYYEAKHTAIQSQVDDIREFKAEMRGRASQTSFYVALIFSLIGAISGIISLLTD